MAGKSHPKKWWKLLVFRPTPKNDGSQWWLMVVNNGL
jgi:hypothetical protein